jgi:hypothetical protein
MVALSTYLGDNGIKHAYCYLETTPEIVAEKAA